MKEIIAYLDQANPSFEEGFALFCKYSNKESLMSYIGRKRDMEALLYNLKKIVKLPPRFINPSAATAMLKYGASVPVEVVSESAPVVIEPAAPVVPVHEKIYRAELPPHLVILYDANTEDYKVISSLHKSMALNAEQGNEQEAASNRNEIIALEEGIKERWARIESEMAVAKSESPSPIAPATPDFNVSSYRAYISKNINSQVPDVRSEVARRASELLRCNVPISDITLGKLKANGLLLF